MSQNIKQLKPKVIVVDGVGINLKTSIMDRLEKLGYPVLRSDSSYYRIADKDTVLFPNRDSFFTKIQCRFMEIMALMDSNRSPLKEAIFVDRGLINQVVWASLNLDDVVDDYTQNKTEYGNIIKLAPEYQKLENKITWTKVLIETQRSDIVKHSLDPMKYDTDEHAAFRIDTFYDVDYYFKVQEEYIKRYNKFTYGNFHHFVLVEDESLENTINYICRCLIDLIHIDPLAF